MNIRRVLSASCQPLCHFYYQQRYYRHHQGVRILMYHRVDARADDDQLSVAPARFATQMAWLAENHQVISLAQMVAQRATTSDEKPQVVLTFDDGYLDNLLYAVPLLLHYQLPATFFVTTEFCQQTQQHPRYGQTAQRLHLNWQEVQQLAKHALFDIGSHTCQHPYLTELSNAQAWQEINDSRQILAEKLGQAPAFFCYPSGNMRAREMDWVQKAGYQAAVTVAPGLNTAATPLWALKRTEITDKDEPIDFQRKLSGGFDPIHQLLHWKRTRMMK